MQVNKRVPREGGHYVIWRYSKKMMADVLKDGKQK
jgi:hypothetical protein